MSNVTFSRVFVEIINVMQAAVIPDFVTGEYLVTKNFFDELSDIQANLIKNTKFSLPTGQEVDPQTTGGMIAIQIFMEAIESRRQAATGLSKLGLSVEKQVWKNL